MSYHQKYIENLHRIFKMDKLELETKPEKATMIADIWRQESERKAQHRFCAFGNHGKWGLDLWVKI